MSCLNFSKLQKPVSCTVQLLDGSNLKFPIRVTDSGSNLLDKVCGHLDLYEKDYFGLRFYNTSNRTPYWLDNQKNILKQLKRYGIKEKRPKFYFSVKFYATDPASLREELTRYLFFLQVRDDVRAGRIPLSFDLQAELGALVAQAELGDYDPRKHFLHYLDALNLTASNSLSKELENATTKLHRHKFCGWPPSKCESVYLDQIRQQPAYGVEFYNIKDSQKKECQIGISPDGIVQYLGNIKQVLYKWPLIDTIEFKGSELRLKVKGNQGTEHHKYVYHCKSSRACKQLWKSCVEYHGFFRLSKGTQPADHKTSLFQLGSKYRYSGRTVKEIGSDESREKQPQVHRASYAHLNTPGKSATAEGAASKNGQDRDLDGKPFRGPTPVANGLFSSGKGSPTSVRSLRMKFPPTKASESADFKQNYQSARYGRHSHRESDNESLMSFGNPFRKHNTNGHHHHHGNHYHHHHHHNGGIDRELQNSASSSILPDYAGQMLKPSTDRIVNGYIKDFSRNPRQSDQFNSNGPRQYENITYTDEGRAIIINETANDRTDENMSTYQKAWAMGDQPMSHPNTSLPSNYYNNMDNSTNYRAYQTHLNRRTNNTDNNHYHNNNMHVNPREYHDDIAKSRSFGFYDDKLLNRDSGTDSPTANNIDEHNNGAPYFTSYSHQRTGHPHHTDLNHNMMANRRRMWEQVI